jgi:DNA-binding MarR family transcriptional regulator
VPQIHEEIKKRKPFTSVEEEVLVALLRTADVLQRPLQALLGTRGVSPIQYNTLRILRGAGEAGLACSEVGQRMITRDPDVTRLLDRLQRVGLVRRARDVQDRRVIKARITRAGLELLRTLDRPVMEMNRRLLGGLGEKRLRELLDLLGAMRQAESNA